MVLKRRTEDECYCVVYTNRMKGDEVDGFESWLRLAQHCEPEIAQKRTQALDSFSSHGEEPAKSVAETRRKVAELEQKIKYAQEITGVDLAEWHKVPKDIGAYGKRIEANLTKMMLGQVDVPMPPAYCRE